MPVPTLEAPNGAEFNGPILNNDNQWIPESRDEYFSYGQEVPSSFLENTVIIQVNPGETFTIQNEDGSYRNIPGPAQVPMVSQNGAIPPIFVPPGYISQVIEENGVRRVVVVPSAVANMDGNHPLPLNTPPFHHLPVHHAAYAPGSHMNGFHQLGHVHPIFSHQHHVFPNCRPDALRFMPRQQYIQDGSNNCSYNYERQYSTPGRNGDSIHACSYPCCQAVVEQQQINRLSLSEPSNFEVSSSRKSSFAQPISGAQHGAGCTPSSQVRVVCCAFSPPVETIGQHWPYSLDGSPQSSSSNCEELPSQTFTAKVGMFTVQNDKEERMTQSESASNKEYLSDSAYSSMRLSCPSETSPLDSPSCASLQSSAIEYNPEHTRVSASDFLPGTSSISPDSASSLESSPHGSPKNSSRANGHHSRCSSINFDAEVCNVAPALPPANLNNFPRTQELSRAPASSPELTDDERGTSANLEQNILCNGVSGAKQYETIEELLATANGPKVHQLKPRTALAVWSLLPTHSASAAIQAKAARKTIRFDLHRRKEVGKFESIYSGSDHQYTMTDLRPATEYCLKLYASWDCKRGPASNLTTFRTPPSQPDTPQPPKLQFKSKTYLVLRWTAPCDNGEKIVKYHVEVTDGLHSNNNSRAFYTSAQKQFKVPKLTPARSYVFRLAAENKIGKSPWSTKVSYLTGGVMPSKPDPPRLSKAQARSLALAWSKPGPEVTGFMLEMSPDTTGYGFRSVYDGPDVKYTVKSLNKNSYYKFRLLAYSADERSHYSEIVSYSTCSDRIPLPEKPQVKGAVHPRHFKITWDCPRECSTFDDLNYSVEMASKTGSMEEIYYGAVQECSVDNVEPGHTYRLRLFCLTAIGKSQPSDVLIVSTPPVLPGSCCAPSLSYRPQAKSLTIKWGSAQSTGGAMSCDYEVNCIASSELSNTEPWIAYKGSDLEATIENLRPGTKYSFAVRAVNKVGCGPWSECMEAITSPSEPEKPEIPEATVLNSSTIHLQWSPPESNGAEISNYLLSWGPDKDSMFPYFTGPVLVHELQSLIPNTTYHFCIQAVNCIGKGPASAIGQARTCPSSPDQVSGLCVGSWDVAGEEDKGHVTSSRISVRWNKPRDNGSDILGYKIHCYPLTSEANSSAPSGSLIEADEASTSYCLKDLNPDTSYSIKVCAFNMISCGCFSSSLTVRTKSPPPLPPRLACVSATYNCLKLEWMNRSKVNPDTIYLLQIQDKYGRYTRAYKGSSQSHKRKNLIENSTYRFRIRTTDSNGVGNFSNEYAFTTPYQAPAALDAPTVYDITESKCKVSWRKANEIKKDTIYYRLYLVMERDNFQKTFTCDGTSYILDCLAPGTTYRLQVCPVRHLDTALRTVEGVMADEHLSTSSSPDLLGPPSSFATFSTRTGGKSSLFHPRLTPLDEVLSEIIRPVAATHQVYTISKPPPAIAQQRDLTSNRDFPRDLKCHKLLTYFMLAAIFIAYVLQFYIVSH